MQEMKRMIRKLVKENTESGMLGDYVSESKLAEAITQYFIKDIKKRIKSLRNRRRYIRRINSWQTYGEPNNLRAVADYLQEELKKGLKES